VCGQRLLQGSLKTAALGTALTYGLPVHDIAVAVSACLRAGTRVDVAWLVEADLGVAPDLGEAVGLTPGGGRLGALLGGALDDRLASTTGAPRLARFWVDDLEAAAHGLAHGGSVSVLVVPAETLPADLWPLLLAREPVAVRTVLDGDRAASTEITRDPALLAGGHSLREVRDGEILSVFAPAPRLVLLGRGAIVDAIEQVAAVVGWKVTRSGEPSRLTLLAQDLAPRDSLVVMSHDLEAATTVLGAGLESEVGYIGALGSRRMQEQRAAWLTDEGYVGLDRIHGPAGLDIGAVSPGEIAVAVIAEAVATHARAAQGIA
jgi:xanthine dehydrogenase accessory factor